MTHRIAPAHWWRDLAPPNDHTRVGSGPRVLLVYEDFTMGLRALDVFAWIAKQAGSAIGTLSVWRFDALECPTRREAATLEAERADILILALHRRRKVSARVASWIEEWSWHRRPRHGALVVILDSGLVAEDGKSDVTIRMQGGAEGAGTSDVTIQMQGVAEAAGLDFFCYDSPRTGGGARRRSEVVTSGAPPSGSVSVLGEDVGGRSFLSGWGINE